MKIYNDISSIREPKLSNLEYYIYVIENNRKDIKVGISHNVSQRIKSLSNSNAGGSSIVRVAVSDPTYLRTLEPNIHQQFDKFRVNGSEWFVGVSFNEVVDYIEGLFQSKSYERLNEMRKNAGGYIGRKRYGNNGRNKTAEND